MDKRAKLKKSIDRLKFISESLEYLYAEELEELQEILDENKYKVAVIGEFSSGKSTFLNALLGKRILYSSNSEATGIVTFLTDGDKPKAFVYDENDCIDEINIDEKQGQNRLQDYVNIKTENNPASKVLIQYPLKNIDKEIVLIDTPGLQGVSEKQREITKTALKQANATIVLITPKGLTETELRLLSGKDENFGEINTKDVFVVINKIGEVYENVENEDVHKKIEEIKESVIEKLCESGVNNIKLFALDSRDYLWSQDDELYKEVLNKNNSNIKTILSQDEYLARSEFDNFKTFLYSFLEKSQRNKNFIEDISEKINLIINAYKEKLQSENSDNSQNNDIILKNLYEKKELLISNKRSLYNNIVRQSDNSLHDYLENINEDLEKIKKDRKKDIYIMVQNNIKNKNDLKQSKFEQCFENVRVFIEKDKNKIENELNDYTLAITDFMLKRKFEDEFMKIFKLKPKFNFSIDYKSLNINLKNEEPNKIYTQDKNLDEIQKKIKELQSKIKDINDNIYRLNEVKKVMSRKKEIEHEILELENKHRKRIKDLGKRPEPVQKYREEIIEKKVFLIFNKKEIKSVKDGLDYTNRNEWDRKKNILDNQYDIDLKKLQKDEYICENEIRDLKIYKERLPTYQNLYEKKKEELKELEKINEKIRQNNEREFLADKKEEISTQIISYANSNYEYIKEKTEDYIYDLSKNIKKKAKSHIENYIDKYSKELEIKIVRAEKKLILSNNKIKEIIKELDNIWGEMQ